MANTDIYPIRKRRPLALFGLPIKRLLIALAAVVALGIHMGMLLFGPNSLTILLGLEEQHAAYEKHIRYLKDQNARLQKEYFELKQLEPEP